MRKDSGQVSGLLQQWIQGDQDALGAVAPLIYEELRGLAHHHLEAERAGHTLQRTPLVNEAFMQLIGSQPAKLQNRAHFVAIASRLMRLMHIDERQGKIVQMKFFGGLTAPGIAEALKISLATVERDWATARIWLRREMSRVGSP